MSEIPPLRVLKDDGSFNQIPVFELQVSGGVLTKIDSKRVQLAISGSQGPSGPPGATLVYAATQNSYVTLSLSTDLTAERQLTGGMGVIILDSGANSHVVLNTNTALLITTARTISTVYPISGGGNLSLDRTFAIDTAFLVNTGRTIASGMGLQGGGDLSADRTLTVNTSLLVTTARTISTIYPVSGGGNLSLDRTFSIDTAFLVNTGRTITAGSGLAGGGDLSTDRRFDVNVNVRSKFFGFFGAGNLSTAMLMEEARIYIPFNMEASGVFITATTAPTGAAIILNLLQWNAALSASTAMFASANRPQIPATAFTGSSLTFDIGTLYAGSWLGTQIDQIGSTNAGSNLTVTLLTRTS